MKRRLIGGKAMISGIGRASALVLIWWGMSPQHPIACYLILSALSGLFLGDLWGWWQMLHYPTEAKQ